MPGPQSQGHSPVRISTVLSSLVVGFVILTVAFPTQAWDFFSGKTVAGSGHVVKEQRTLAPFHKVSVDLPTVVELVQGDTEDVQIEADDNLLPLIETQVINGQLRIQVAKGFNFPRPSKIRLTVNARQVDSLAVRGSADLSVAHLQASKLESSIAGSGHITIRDLHSRDLSVSIAGSGNFEAQGTAATMDVSIAGSGDVRTPLLSTQKTSVSIAGSGDATVWVRQALSVSIAGSGGVRYYGEGILQESSITGSGRVRQIAGNPPGA